MSVRLCPVTADDAPSVSALARSVAAGELDLEALRHSALPAGELRKRLLSIKGVGPYAVPHFCDVYHTKDPNYYNSIQFWKTPTADCGGAGGTCVDYSAWTQAWTSIKSGT